MPPSPAALPLTFTARVTKGAGRGRQIGSPTLNLQLKDVPATLAEGIFVCRAHWNRRSVPAALHYGPRPVFRAGTACELHIIDHVLTRPPRSITVEVLRFLRPVRDFRTVELLKKQIARDISITRVLVSASPPSPLSAPATIPTRRGGIKHKQQTLPSPRKERGERGRGAGGEAEQSFKRRTWYSKTS